MTTFKLFFNQDDIRRVTKQVTSYEQFVTFLEGLYPQYHCELLIKYDDKEGDRIAVTSQLEWDEMMEELCDEKVIKLYITEGPNPRGYFKDGPKPESLHYYTNEVTKEPGLSEELLNKLDKNVTKCLEYFFRDGKIIPGHIPSFLKDVVGVKYNKQEEVDIDVDVYALAGKLHKMAMECLSSMDKELIQKGKEYMVSLVNLDPKNCISQYNLACAESLLNRVPEALSALEAAIRNGYDNLEHMIEDKDFDNIRTSEGFMKLVDLMTELQSNFCENCEGEDCEDDCKDECKEKCKNVKECKIVKDEKVEECCGGEKNCCMYDDDYDEPVVLEYDCCQDSTIIQYKNEDEIEPKVEKTESKVEDLNNKLSESFIDLRSKWTQQISDIKSLGFLVDDEVLSLLLEQTNGNIEEVVNLLVLNK